MTVARHAQVWLVLPAAEIAPLFHFPRSLYAIVVNSLVLQAKQAWGCAVRPIAFHGKSRTVFDLTDGQVIAIRRPLIALSNQAPIVVLNASFIQERSHEPERLVELAGAHELSLCLTPTGEFHAFAFVPARRKARTNRVIELLGLLAGSDPGPLRRQEGDNVVVAAGRSPQRSPAMADVNDVSTIRRYDSSRYLDAALLEVATRPESLAPLQSADQLQEALGALRLRSRVPWIFNELLCEVDHRLAAVRPMSVPPEIHVSLTGSCNVECRFCSYEHALAKTGRVTVEQIERLEFVPWIRTIRLHSGNGESTSNPHLPQIIQSLTKLHPHLELNFSTNGLLLDRPGLIDALVGGVSWINVSLNAATREGWAKVHGVDRFERVCANLQKLRENKRAKRRLNPTVMGSMVLTRHSCFDLPMMPALCRQLGVDYLTAIPFFSFRYYRGDRFGPDDAYHVIGDAYDSLYWRTVEQAEAHGVSVELPAPYSAKDAAFGLELRKFHDFACMEAEGGWRLARLLSCFDGFQEGSEKACPALWRVAHIATTSRSHVATDETHFLYPCLGPLGAIDFSQTLPFRFQGGPEFAQLWHGSIFRNLREAQRRPGKSVVCDTCRGCDSRDPKTHLALERDLDAFRASMNSGLYH
ncbi:radical SAM protein [Bradyrhizobium sp. CCBAU 11361]|uniref:radical SAM protein n=1 Tax=Bradyrhizobium sp. CCBAU 11361 TaxID=1630812 RepID=UPI0023043EE7|nr:radical SAM protein [Bradyrhizobium sp. CCBAU 11361]MDA9490378.1 hypothetical protein [Bradyrhizobium sp. CCBAU 11361]